eukprot:6921708-Prorocentrum_lima.AAC.1
MGQLESQLLTLRAGTANPGGGHVARTTGTFAGGQRTEGLLVSSGGSGDRPGTHRRRATPCTEATLRTRRPVVFSAT